MFAWSEVTAPPSSRGVTSPSTRSRPRIIRACRIWSDVTVQFAPSATTTVVGRLWARARAASTSSPSVIWRQPWVFTSNPSATRSSTAPSITESPTASGGGSPVRGWLGYARFTPPQSA